MTNQTWLEAAHADGSAYQRALDRIGAEYRDLPGMSLTFDQARRLCGTDRWICNFALDSLVAAGVLELTPAGRFRRCHDGFIEAGAPTKPSADFLMRNVSVTFHRCASAHP